MMSSFDGSTHRLPGSSGMEAGGLFVRKKPTSDGGRGSGGVSDEFKAPKGSLLGLDVLAKKKREEREESGRRGLERRRDRWDEKGKEERGGDPDGGFESDVRISFGKSDRTKAS